MPCPHSWDSSDAWYLVGNSSWSCMPAGSLSGIAFQACSPLLDVQQCWSLWIHGSLPASPIQTVGNHSIHGNRSATLKL
jgi:hypothetical protein